MHGFEVGVLPPAKGTDGAFGLRPAASGATGSDGGELTSASITDEVAFGAAPDTQTREEEVEESATPGIRHFTLRQPAGIHPGG